MIGLDGWGGGALSDRTSMIKERSRQSDVPRAGPPGTPPSNGAAGPTLTVRLHADGTFELDGAPRSPAQLADLLQRPDDASPTPVLILEPAATLTPEALGSALAALTAAGIDTDSIITKLPLPQAK